MNQSRETNCVGAGQATDADTVGGIASTLGQGARKIVATVELRADSHFERALGLCKDGARITRAGWNASGQYVEAQYPDSRSRMSVPYLVLKNSQGDLVPWVPSQGDLFARDWAILPRA